MRSFILILLFPFLASGQQAASEYLWQANRNYLLNGDFEKGTTGWTISGISTISSFSPTRLDRTGKQSLSVFSTPATTGYFAQAIAIDKNLANKNCSVSVLYENSDESVDAYLTVFSGASLGSLSEINSNFRVTFPATVTGQSRTARISSFTCPDSGYVQFRIVFPSLNKSINIDNAYLGLAEFGEVANVTSWMTYTPTITASSGSLTNFSLTGTEYMMVGSSIFIKGTLTFTGAVGTWNRPRISLPAGMVIDNTAPATMSGVLFNDTGTNRYGSDVTLTQGTSFVQIESYRGSNGVLVDPTQAAPFAWTSGDSISWTIGPIKIVGLDISSTVINAECPTERSCVNLFHANVSTGGVITEDKYGMLSSCTAFTSGASTCTFTSNFFSVQPKCWASSTSINTATFALEHTYSGTTSVTIDRRDEVGTRRPTPFILYCKRSGADEKNKIILQAQISNTVYSGTNGVKSINGEFNCDASSSIASQTGGVATIGNRSTTSCALTITSGFFSATPYKCTPTVKSTTVNAMSCSCSSATSCTVYGPNADYDFYLDLTGI